LGAQLVGRLITGRVDVTGDLPAEHHGEPLLKGTYLLAQPTVLRFGVGRVGAQRGDRDVPVRDGSRGPGLG
jgi:hypothetical protein